MIIDKSVTVRQLKEQLVQSNKIASDLQRELAVKEIQIRELTLQCNAIENAFWWKITKPMRVVVNLLNRALKEKAKTPQPLNRVWRLRRSAKNKQKQHIFSKDVKFSIIVPLYNTPKQFMSDMIDSVINQTYANWELCLADASDTGHEYIPQLIESLPPGFRSRIKYKKLAENLGIAENTNECIKMSAGDYLVLLDHDDALHFSALFENMKVICEKDADFIYSDECKFHDYKKDAYYPFFKPDFSPDTLRGSNYICHLTVFSRQLLNKAGMFRIGFNGSQDYDLILRLTEQATCIVHIPKILYFWRSHTNSVASGDGVKSYAYDAAVKALSDQLHRLKLKGTVLHAAAKSHYRIKYELIGTPLISIIIPNTDNEDVLRNCLNSINDKTSYKNYELIIVENNSNNPETFAYYKSVETHPKVRLITWFDEYNFSSINNYAVSEAKGEYIVFLNNDTEVISGNWLEEMLMFAQRDDVGAVGAMLYYPDDTIQHAGIILGACGLASHAHYRDGSRRGDIGYFGRLITPQNMTGVTAACMMLPKDVFIRTGGFNEALPFNFNDVDLCLSLRKAGYLVVWTPYAELYHYESKTRGSDDTPEKLKRFQNEIALFKNMWADELAMGDPYYNVNLPPDKTDYYMNEYCYVNS